MSAAASPGCPSWIGTTSSTLSWATSRALEPNQRRPSSHSVSVASSSAASVASALAIDQLHVGLGVLLEQEPELAPRRECEQVGKLADAWEARAPEHLLGPAPFVG